MRAQALVSPPDGPSRVKAFRRRSFDSSFAGSACAQTARGQVGPEHFEPTAPRQQLFIRLGAAQPAQDARDQRRLLEILYLIFFNTR